MKILFNWMATSRFALLAMTKNWVVKSSFALLAMTIILTLTTTKSIAAPTILHQSSNMYGSVYVYETEKMRCLSFVPPGSYVQTCILPQQSYIIPFDYLKMILGSLYLSKEPKKILMLGLGGGALANAIPKILPHTQLDIVEINPIVPELAKKYFGLTPNKNVHIFVQDGFYFIEQAKPETYDIIIVDAFTKDYAPPLFLTEEFVENVKKKLKPNGVVAVNSFVSSKYYKTESKLYKKAFGSFFNLTGGGNRIILASKSGILPKHNMLKKQADKWAFSFHLLGIDSNWLLARFGENN